MTWFGGDGWGWCGSVFNGFAMAVFWGAVVTAVLLAVYVLGRGRSNPSVVAITGSSRAEGGPPVRLSRGEIGDDDFYRRLM